MPIIMKNTEPRVQKAQWFLMSASDILKVDNLMNIKEWKSSECCVNSNRFRSYITQKHPPDTAREGDINQVRCNRTAWQLDNWKRCNKTKLVNSDPCLGTHNWRPNVPVKDLLKKQYNKERKIHLINKGLPNTHLLNASLTSISTNEIAECKRRQLMGLVAGIGTTTLEYPHFINNYMPVHTSNNSLNLKRNTNEKNTPIMVILPRSDYSKNILCFYTTWDPYLEKSSSVEHMTKEQNVNCSINYARIIEHFGNTFLKNAVTWKHSMKNLQNGAPGYRYELSPRPELAAEILRSSVVIKSNLSHIKQLTSNCKVQPADDREMQLHRQPSLTTLEVHMGPYAQTYVVYNVMEQANTRMKEKGTSQQFKQRSQGIGSASISGNDSSSGSSKKRTIRIESGVSFSVEFIDKDKGKSTDTETSSPETAGDTKTKKGKKDLHRCLCTTSFPTDDKKLKNKPCDSGVCVTGKCTPSECFKRLQEKYGSKKKSASDVSSSQASQTSKKKEREGEKKTLVKEKGSPSISKYKESVEVKPLPEKQKEKFDIVKCITNCCNKMQFWKKDKPIELKPAVIGTDISVKDDKAKTFGSNAATQSGKKRGKKEENKGEKKGEKKGKKKEEKKEEKKDKKKEEKKDEKKEEKKGKAAGTGKKDKKISKKDAKKADVKAPGKKDKKVSKKSKGEEVKTETKATGVKTKKGRALQPYECEPGVCTPKACDPKECYERKFPPPPKQAPPKSKFIICLRKLCCRKTPAGVSAATQARKPGVPAMPLGATVYKETGSASTKTAKGKKGDKQAVDAGYQAPVEGGDVSKTKKQTAYSGIQYFQTVDTDTMMQRQGLNIGSECSCSVEFYKMLY